MSNDTNVTLDGTPVTQQQLNEARANPNVRIVEDSPGVFRTLKRLQG